MFESDAAKKKDAFQKFHAETINPHLEKIEQHLSKNGSGYLVGKSVNCIH